MKNVCALRVTHIASDKLTWEEVARMFKKIGPLREGYTDRELLSVWKKIGVKHKQLKISPNTRLSDFRKKFPKGVYVLSYHDHFTAVVNGKHHDFDRNREWFRKNFVKKVYKIISM